MADEFDVQKWKDDFVKDMKFGSDEDKAAFLKAIDGNVDTIKRGYNTVSEGSRLANEALTKQREADEAKKVADEAMVAAKKKDSDADAYFLQLQAHEADVNKVVATNRQYVEILTANGIDPESAVGRELIKQNTEPVKPAFDMKELEGKFLSTDMAKNLAMIATDLPFDVAAAQSRYERVNGSTKDVDWAAFRDAAKANLMKGIPVSETAETLFDFKTKEAALAEKSIEDRIAAKAEELVTAKLSAMNIPNPQNTPVNSQGPNYFSSDFANHAVEGAPKSAQEIEDAALKHFIDTTNEAGMPPMSYG